MDTQNFNWVLVYNNDNIITLIRCSNSKKIISKHNIKLFYTKEDALTFIKDTGLAYKQIEAPHGGDCSGCGLCGMKDKCANCGLCG
jgi:hypothetical protein